MARLWLSCTLHAEGINQGSEDVVHSRFSPFHVIWARPELTPDFTWALPDLWAAVSPPDSAYCWAPHCLVHHQVCPPDDSHPIPEASAPCQGDLSSFEVLFTFGNAQVPRDRPLSLRAKGQCAWLVFSADFVHPSSPLDHGHIRILEFKDQPLFPTRFISGVPVRHRPG